MLTMGELQGFWAVGGPLKYVDRSTASSPDLTDVSSTTLATPTGTTSGDLLVAWILRDGDNSSDVTCSGWVLYSEDTYQNLAGSLLYRWATVNEPASHTFAHTDTTYGGMGGVLIVLRNSIANGACPILFAGVYNTYADNANTDLTFTAPDITVAAGGAVALLLGAARRDSTVTGGIQMDCSGGIYNALTASAPIGGRGTSGASIGGGAGYAECAAPQAITGISGILINEVGDLKSTRSWRARQIVLI
jgi:hypothetical protein